MSPPATADRHDWRIVAPWYRWERTDGLEPERAADAARPVLHKFASTSFVADYLRDPQRCMVFDESIDVHQRVEKIPTAELKAADGRLRSLSRRRLVPTTTRKLFLPAHQRFYVAAVGIHCDQPGFPKVDPDAIAEVGFVIRRHRVDVPTGERGRGAALLAEVTRAEAMAASRHQLDAAKGRSRVLHPFTAASRHRVTSPASATVAAFQEIERARRRLKVWADEVGVEDRTEGWVPGAEGSFGEWMMIADEPSDVVERAYPMRLLTPDPDDPDHAAHDGTIFYAAVPTASDEVTADGTSRFNELDSYEIRVFARVDVGDCPGPLVWSSPSRTFRLASFYDPTGCAQRPLEVRLPDFAQLEATAAMPSVRMTQPEGSSLVFSKFGKIPTKGTVGQGREICFFSIPLITIIAMFVLNLFLPIVVFIFQLWWMLKLKFCIPPSAEFEADLEAALDLEPGQLELAADLDVDLLPGQAGITAVLEGLHAPIGDPGDELTPPQDLIDDVTDSDWHLGKRLTGTFTNDPLVKLAIRQGYGSSTDGAPTYTTPITYTTPVRREEVVHP